MKLKIDKSQKPNAEDNRRDDLIRALQRSGDTFLNGALYSMVHSTIVNIVSRESASNFDPKLFLLSAVSSGIEFAGFDFTNGTLDALFQPNLDTFGKWIPWTISTATLSAIVSRLAQTPLKNKIENGEFSYKGFQEDTKSTILQSVGFNTAKSYADMVLPPKEKVGGKYMRSTLCLAAGNLGSATVSLPMMIQYYPLKTICVGFLPTIPLCFVENAIFSSVKSLTKPIRLLPK